MDTATLALGILTVILFALARRRRDGSERRGLKMAWTAARRTAILLLLAFAIVGYVNVLSPQDLVQRWIGPQSGLRGLLIGELVGMILPGGPYAVFPLIATLYGAGAGLGPAITIIVSWAMLGLVSVSFELSFMGWRFTLVRWGLGLVFPILAGLLAQALFGAGGLLFTWGVWPFQTP